MDPFQKVTAGDKIKGRQSADLHNLLVDMAQEYARTRGDFETGPSAGPGKLELRIRNETTTALAQYAVVGFGAELVAPAAADVSFFGPLYVSSAAPAPGKPFAVLQLPAPPTTVGSGAGPGAIVPAIAAGMTLVLVDVLNVTDTFADAVAGDYTRLLSQSGAGPAEVLLPRPFVGTGNQWALVRLGAPDVDVTFDNCGPGFTGTKSYVTDIQCIGGIQYVYKTDYHFCNGRELPIPDAPYLSHTAGCCGCGSTGSIGSVGSGSVPCVTCVTITGAGSGGCNGTYCAIPVGTNLWAILGLNCNVGLSCIVTPPTGGCDCLTSTYSQVSVAFPGVISGNCNCTFLTSPVALPFAGGGEYCGWHLTQPGVCPGLYTALLIDFTVQCTPGGQIILLTVAHRTGTSSSEAYYVPVSASLWDGASPLLMKFSSAGASGEPVLGTHWPATVTVTPGGSLVSTGGCTCILTVNGTNYTSNAGAVCSPAGAVFTGVDLGPCGCGSATVTVGPCGSTGSAGSGSTGSSGGGGCGAVTLLGTANSNGASVPTLSKINVTVDANALLVVDVMVCNSSVGVSGVTFGGTALTLQGSVGSGGSNSGVSTWSLLNGGSPVAGDIVASVSGGGAACMMAIREVEPGPAALISVRSAGGLATQPNTGATGSLTASCAYAMAAFGTLNPSGGTLSSPFASEGQRITMNIAGTTYQLQTVYVSEALTATVLDASYTGLTVTEWAALLTVFA